MIIPIEFLKEVLGERYYYNFQLRRHHGVLQISSPAHFRHLHTFGSRQNDLPASTTVLVGRDPRDPYECLTNSEAKIDGYEHMIYSRSSIKQSE